MTHRGGRGDKDRDCYQLLEGTSQPHPSLPMVAPREEARRDAEDWLASETCPPRGRWETWPACRDITWRR